MAIRTERLAHELISEEGRGDTPFGTYVVPSSHPASELGRELEREVFHEFFGNTPELLDEEYAAYEASSMFLTIVDHERERAAGGMRVILPSPAGFKSLDDIEHGWHEPAADVIQRTGITIDPFRTWDIATFAVAGDYRGDKTDGLISLALYQAVSTLATANDIETIVCILDLVVMDLIQTRTHRPLRGFDGLEPANYLDSPASLPVHWDLEDHRQRLSIIDPGLLDLFYRGSGLETVVSTPEWGIVAEPELTPLVALAV